MLLCLDKVNDRLSRRGKESCQKTFVITNPMIAANKSAEVTLSKFLRVISTKDAEIIVIGGNVTVESDLSDVRLISCRAVRAANKVKRVMDHLLLQLWMTVQVLVNINKGMACILLDWG